MLALGPVRALAQDGQIDARVAVDSDLRWRGYTLSAGHPVASADVGYDDISGFYVNGSAIAEFRGDDVRYLGFTASGGYSARLGDRWSLDAGVERAQYRPASPYGPEYDYTEVYIGLTRRPVLARVSFSPDYLTSGVRTLYLETEGTVRLPATLRLNGHFGLLALVDHPAGPAVYRTTQYDWRVGLSRPFGNAEIHVSLSGGGPGKQYYEEGIHSRTALTGGASFSF